MKKYSELKKTLFMALTFLCCFVLSLTLLTNTGLHAKVARAEATESETTQLRYGDGSVYNGETIDSTIRNGTGTYIWSTGESESDNASYEGQWVNNTMTGFGELVLPGIGVYKGDFLNNKRQGKGSFIWTYEGEPATGSPVSFEGDWDNDKIGAQGTLVIAGLGTYVGSFCKQQRSGSGTFTWNDGSIYEGDWTNDQINGDGTYTLPDGTILKGKFQKGTLFKGTVTYAVENGTAIRNITAGKAQPDVRVTYNDGTILEGKTKAADFIGNVTVTYSNGDQYVGTIQNGLKHGKGTYTWRSGAHYKGEWRDDLMSGSGKYYYGKSEKDTYLTGNFLNGKPEGTLTYVAENKLKYKTIWKNGSVTSITYMK